MPTSALQSVKSLKLQQVGLTNGVNNTKMIDQRIISKYLKKLSNFAIQVKIWYDINDVNLRGNF